MKSQARNINDLEIDFNARKIFEKQLTGYAGIYAVKSLKISPCLNKYNQDFRDGKQGARDATRAAIHFEAAGLKNSESRVLAYFLAIAKTGKLGTIVPEEINACAVRETTGSACSPRTYRAALASLCRRGWLSKSMIPTGTKIVISVVEGDPVWRSLRVLKVSLTRAARMLIAKKPAENSNKTHIDLHRQKLPLTVSLNNNTREIGTISSVIINKDNLKKSIVKEPQKSCDFKCLDKSSNLKPTTPSSLTTTIKHESSVNASRSKLAKIASLSKNRHLRKSRNSTLKTWESARKTLITDIFAQLHKLVNINDLIQIVEIQTDRFFPPALQSALNWDLWIWKWHDLTWQQRRRAVHVEILPALTAFNLFLQPVDKIELNDPALNPDRRAQLLEQFKTRENLKSWLEVIPAHIPAHIPAGIRENLNRERWRLNTLSRLIQNGKIKLDTLTQNDFCLLSQAATATGKDTD